MKVLISTLMFIVLAGCSLLPPEYDGNEYMQFARLETHSRFLQTECDRPELAKNRIALMLYDSELLISYSFFLPHHSDIIKMANILSEDVYELVNRYNADQTPSIAYCKLKAKAFTVKVRRSMDSISKTQRG